MHWKKALEGMNPYKPGRSIEEVKRQYGLKEVVKLASNENPYGCGPSVLEFIKNADIEPQIYPDGYAGSLRKKLSEKHGVAEDRILFGNGSDEIVMIISRAILSPGTNAVMATPTFPQYAHNARIEGAEVREVGLIDGQHDLEGFLKAIDENTAVAWLCNPNNPTGNLIPNDDLIAFLKRVPDHVLVVLDEAYFEYITDKNHSDSIPFLENFPNAIVLRTFSKAYGLAAYRIGYGVGHSKVVTYLNTVRSPFNVTSLSLAIAEKALDDDEFVKNCNLVNGKQKERFIEYANQNKLHIFESQANFVLIEVPGNSDEASEKLLQQGFIVRSGEALGTPGYVRVTIGTEDQNTGFLAAFDSLLTDAKLSL